jgi:uncharacterized HAD superfamily protein
VCNDDNVRHAVVFDIDGCLADNSRRIARLNPAAPDWDEFHRDQHEDPVLESQAALMRMLHQTGYYIILLTARPEDYRWVTETWLGQHGLPHHALIMRHPEMPNRGFKKEVLTNLMRMYVIRLVLDDDPDVITDARSLSIPAMYVHSGYYHKESWGTDLRPSADLRDA